jgi:uncharacterized protein VirK/YbjX
MSSATPRMEPGLSQKKLQFTAIKLLFQSQNLSYFTFFPKSEKKLLTLSYDACLPSHLQNKYRRRWWNMDSRSSALNKCAHLKVTPRSRS